MKISTKEIIEVGGILAVVASLIFVGIQLRQEQIFAQADLGSITLEALADFDKGFEDSNVASIYVKMISDPEELSIEEMTQANASLNHIVRLWIREDFLYGLGVFTENERIVDEYVARMFGNTYAKAWWNSSKGRFPDFSEKLSTAIDSVGSGESLEFFGKVQAQL